MIEGLADTFATSALTRLGLYDRGALERRYWGVARECARELAREPLADARGRGAYVCGDLAGVAMLGLLPQRDLAAVWKAARAASPDGRVSLDALCAALTDAGATAEGVEALRRFVQEPHGDTDQAIRALLEAAQLAPVYVDGSLSSLQFPF